MKKSLRLAATLLLAIPVLAAAASTDTVAHRTAHAQHAATHPRAHAHRHAAPKRAHHAESARHHEGAGVP